MIHPEVRCHRELLFWAPYLEEPNRDLFLGARFGSLGAVCFGSWELVLAAVKLPNDVLPIRLAGTLLCVTEPSLSDAKNDLSKFHLRFQT